MTTYLQNKAYAESQRLHPRPPDGTGTWRRKCQMFSRSCVHAPAWGHLNALGRRTALTAWQDIPAVHRHTGRPPAGALAYFEKPGVADSRDAGHTGFVVENGKMYHTDALGEGRIWLTDYLWPVQHWGMRYLGWIDWTPSGAISLKKPLAPSSKPSVPVPTTPWTDPAYPRPNNKVPPFPGAAAFGPGKTNDQILLWGARMVLLSYLRIDQLTHSWSSALDSATTAFQRSLGFSGSGADGLPGPSTWDAAWKHAVPRHPWPRTLTPQGDFSLLAGCALVATGYAGYYRAGPSRSWGSADHNNLVAFQRAHGLPATGQTDLTTWTRLGLS